MSNRLERTPKTWAERFAAMPHEDRIMTIVEDGSTFDALLQEVAELQRLYWDLIYQVGTKYPGESRHDTAKRYLNEKENASSAQEARGTGEGER